MIGKAPRLAACMRGESGRLGQIARVLVCTRDVRALIPVDLRITHPVVSPCLSLQIGYVGEHSLGKIRPVADIDLEYIERSWTACEHPAEFGRARCV